MSDTTVVSAQIVSGTFSRDPIGAMRHYLDSQRSAPAKTDERYATLLAQLEADFQLLGSVQSKLQKNYKGYILTVTRADGAVAISTANADNNTIDVMVKAGLKNTSFTLQINDGKVLNYEEVAVIIAETLSGLDNDLRVTLTRAEQPELFKLLGVDAKVESLVMVSTFPADMEIEDKLKQTFDAVNRDRGGSVPTPFMGQVFFTLVDQHPWPVRSLDIIRMNREGKSADIVGEGGFLGLFVRRYDEYRVYGMVSPQLSDLQENILYGMMPDGFNKQMQRLIELHRANPTHGGLAQIAHYLPQIRKAPGVVIPDPKQAPAAQ